MVCVLAEGRGDTPHEPVFHGSYVLAGRNSGSVGNPVDVRINRNGRVPERDIQDNIGRLSPHSGKRLQFLP